MQFKEAFDHMTLGRICFIEDCEYKLDKLYPPRLQRRDVGKTDDDWLTVESLGYFYFSLASDLWQVKE